MTWTLKFLRLIHVAHKFLESLCTTDKSNAAFFLTVLSIATGPFVARAVQASRVPLGTE